MPNPAYVIHNAKLAKAFYRGANIPCTSTGVPVAPPWTDLNQAKPKPSAPVSPPAGPRCFVLMGRFGDIIMLLPAFKEWADRTGHPTVVVTSVEFGDVLDGVSYVQAVKLDLRWMLDLSKALDFAREKYPDATLVQLNGGTIHDLRDNLPSYSLSMWNRTGLLEDYAKLPLVFDRRNREREEALYQRLKTNDKPLLLFSSVGTTSPLVDQRVFHRIHESFEGDCQILDLHEIRLQYVFDLLGLMDRAAGLVTIDTMHLHLAAASPKPYIALTRSDGRPASVPKGNCVLKVGYDEAAASAKAIMDIVRTWMSRS